MRNVIIVIIAVFIIWGIYYLMKPTPLPSPSKDKPTEPASSNTTKPTTANQPLPKKEPVIEPANTPTKITPQPTALSAPAKTGSGGLSEEQFETKMESKGMIKVGDKWLTPLEKEEAEKVLSSKPASDKGLIEYKGKLITPQEKEALSFQEQMKKQGYVWEADRWLKKGEKHPWDPNKKPETLPPPPQVDKGQGSIAQNSTPRILLKVEKCFIKSREDGQVVILTGKTDFPNGTILVNEFSHYFEPDMALSRTEITINRKEYDKTFSAIIGPLAETIPKGLYLVTTKFNPFIQTNDVLAKTGRQTAKDTLTLIVGTKKDIENMINLTVPKLESIIAESEDLYKELGENYQSTTASKDTKTFSVWTKEFLKKIKDVNKKLPSYNRKSIFPTPFTQTERKIKSLLSNLVSLKDKYALLLEGKSLPHIYEDKYVSTATFDTYLKDAKDQLAKDKQAYEDIIKNN